MRQPHRIALFVAVLLGLATPRAVDRLMAAGGEVQPAAPATAPVSSELDESEQILRELLHTDRLIAVLRPKISRSGNAKAQEQLAESTRREKEARSAFENHLYARAIRLTREARSLAREAAVMVGPPEEDPIYVSRTIEHAADALGLAEDALQGVSLTSVKKRYAELSHDLETARQLYKNGAVRRAYEQATSVRNGVLALLGDCESLPVSSETAERALKGAERALERAGKDLGPKPNAAALRLRKEATAQLAKARSSFARKEFKDAVIHSKLVERNLDDALAAQRGSVKPGVRNAA